jgi:hypothetical protein
MSGGQRHSQQSKFQGGLPGSNPLRSDGSRGSQTGWLDRRNGGLKHTEMKVRKLL